MKVNRRRSARTQLASLAHLSDDDLAALRERIVDGHALEGCTVLRSFELVSRVQAWRAGGGRGKIVVSYVPTLILSIGLCGLPALAFSLALLGRLE